LTKVIIVLRLVETGPAVVLASYVHAYGSTEKATEIWHCRAIARH